MQIILDASAYRTLARDLDAAAARARGRLLAERDAARGHRAVASPFALWSLLDDVALTVAAARRGPSEAEHARAGRARAALALLAEHCARRKGEEGAHPFVLGEDGDTRLFRAVGIKPPPGLAAWNEYLASVATDVALEPTAERAQRLSTPLSHVAERAKSTAEDWADEMQDAVLATYDYAEEAWGWTADTSDDVRQRALTGPVVDPLGGELAPDMQIGEALMLDLLRRDPLLRALAEQRAARVHRLARATPSDDVVEPTLDEAARVAERFPRGLTIARALLRRVLAGDLEMAGRAARRWLWNLHTMSALEDERGVTGSDTLADAWAGVAGVETVAAYGA